MKPLATVYRVQVDGMPRWQIRCEYCGHADDGDSMEVAGANFFEHMFFGKDTSLEHMEYAAGKRRSVRAGGAR